MMFGLNRDEIDAGAASAAENPYEPARDTPPGFFEGSGAVMANIPETSASGLILAGNVIGGKVYGEQEGDQEFRSDLVDLQKKLRPDPATTGMLGQVLYGVGKILPQAVAGGLVAGPVGAAGLVATTQGIEETKRLESEGVDDSTATKAGVVEGITQGVGVVIPASMGTRLATRLATGTALNVTLGGVSRGSTGAILRANGYHDMAEQYRVLDGAALLTDAILGSAFGAMGGHGKKGEPAHDPINDNHPGDLDLGLAANDVRQFELDSSPGIPTDIETRNAHTKAMDTGINQLLAGRDVDVGDTLENTTFLTRPGNPEINAAFKEAAVEHGISPILLENNKRGEAVVQSVVERSLREAGRSQIEAESTAPLFARTLARFAEPFGQPVQDAFNRSLLEFQQLDEQGRTVALGNNVTSLLNDVDAIGRGETLDPSVHAAAADFGDRLAQLGITPEQARLMPAQQLLDQVYNVGKPAVEGAENLPTLEVSQNPDGQLSLGMRESPQAVDPLHQQAVTDRLMQAPAVEKSPLGFVSKMERVLGQKLNNTGTVDQFKEQLDAFQKSGQYKPDERFWSGIDDFLDNMKEMDGPDAKLNKQDIIDFLQNNRIKLEEAGEGGGGDLPRVTEDDLTNHGQEYNEPDSSWIEEMARDNYYDEELTNLKREQEDLAEDMRETDEKKLEETAMQRAIEHAEESARDDEYNYTTRYSHRLDLPNGKHVDIDINELGGGDTEWDIGDGDWHQVRNIEQALQAAHDAIEQKYGVTFGDEGAQFEEYTGDGGSNYRFFRLRTDELKGGTFRQTGHYPETNVLLHYRTKDRVGPNGEKMLFMEELQSDIHQAAYKSKLKSGIAYRTDMTPEMREKLDNDMGLAKGEMALATEAYNKAGATLSGEVGAKLEGLSSNDKQVIADTIKRVLREDKLEQVPFGEHEDFSHLRGLIGVDKIVDRAFDLRSEGQLDDGAYFHIRKAGPEIERMFSENDALTYPEMVNEFFDHRHMLRTEAVSRGIASDAALDKTEENIEAARKWMLEQPAPKSYTRAEIEKAVQEIIDQHGEPVKEAAKAHAKAGLAEQDARLKLGAADSAPPGAPFSKTWREVGFKRMIARAVDEGYDSIGWTTGTQQNVRYNLSNFIDGVSASKAPDGSYIVKSDRRTLDALHQAVGREERGSAFIKLTDEELENALGKEGADAVRSQVPADGKTGDIDFAKSLEVGGDRKGNLYDGMLPQEAGKILKKLDPSIKVAETDYKMRERGRDIDKIWYAPITEKAKAEAAQGFELFQKERGAITFNRASAKDFEGRLKKVVIEFGTAADESTAAHEFSHWATATHRMYADLARKRIEAGDLSPEVKRIADDWETLKKEVGAKDDVFTADQEEKIASWFEGYMRTGEAPSAQLQAIFDRFKEWLTKIYQDITGKGMEVSPAVKDVFDRWLADSDEIAAKKSKADAAARDEHVDDTNVANMGETGGEPGADTAQQAAVDPIQQILAEKPDLMVADENGNVVPAQEALDNAQAEVEQAQKDASLFEVAINCFLRHSDA